MSRIKDGARCRGGWVLGNNCGECGHCLATARVGVTTIRRLTDEAQGLREALRRIAARCGGWSPADVRAAVADALGCTVDELEGGAP